MAANGTSGRSLRGAPAWLALLVPNWPGLLFAAAGIAAEYGLLWRAGGLPARTSFSAFLLLLLIWFWLGLTWLLWAATGGIRRAVRSWPPAARWLVAGPIWAVLSGALVVYLGSWAMYLKTGQFATYSGLRFVLLEFPRMTRFYVLQSEPGNILLFGLACVIGIGGVFALWRRADDLFENAAAFGRVTCWLALTALCAFWGHSLLSSRSLLLKGQLTTTLRDHTNPALALLAEFQGRHGGPAIERSLPVKLLEPRSEGYPFPAGKVDRSSIVFVKVESLRADVLGLVHQGSEVMPNLNSLARQGVSFARAYADSTHTDYSVPAVLSSLYPLRKPFHYLYRRDDPWPKTLIYDLLKHAGYAAAVVAADNLSWGATDKFLETPALDLYFDAQHSEGIVSRVHHQNNGLADEIRAGGLTAGVLDDEPTTDRAIAWVRDQTAAGRPFFLYLDLQSSHFPYKYRKPRGTAPPFRPALIDFDVSFMDYPPERDDVMRNAYYNALWECDRQIGRLVELLKRQGRLSETILVVFGDHGEAFHEHGLVTHAGLPIESVIRVPLVFFAPGRLATASSEYPAELIDVVPSVLGLMRWPQHPNFQGSDLFSANRPPVPRRLLFIHTDTPSGQMDCVIQAGRWKFCRDRQTGATSLFDVVDDPGETSDSSARLPAVAAVLERVLETWRGWQLAYYRYSSYYTEYYPPRGPAAPQEARGEATPGGSPGARERTPSGPDPPASGSTDTRRLPGTTLP